MAGKMGVAALLLLQVLGLCDGLNFSGREGWLLGRDEQGVLKEARGHQLVDVDDDGWLDVVVATADGIYIAHGYGKGKVSKFYEVLVPIEGTLCFLVVDIDADKKLDAVVGTPQGLLVYPLLKSPPILWASEHVNVLLIEDMDRDGHLDIVYGSRVADMVWWMRGGSTGFKPRALLTRDPLGPVSMAAGDIDGDGDVELVVASGDGEHISWHRQQGEEKAWSTSRIPNPTPGVVSVALMDFDGNGMLDIVSAQLSARKVVVHLQVPPPASSPWKEVVVLHNTRVSHVLVADVDNDGSDDIVASSMQEDTIAIVTRKDNNNLQVVASTVSVCADLVQQTLVEDIDGDGDKDVVALVRNRLPGGDSVRWWAQDTSPTSPAPAGVCWGAGNKTTGLNPSVSVTTDAPCINQGKPCLPEMRQKYNDCNHCHFYDVPPGACQVQSVSTCYTHKETSQFASADGTVCRSETGGLCFVSTSSPEAESIPIIPIVVLVVLVGLCVIMINVYYCLKRRRSSRVHTETFRARKYMPNPTRRAREGPSPSADAGHQQDEGNPTEEPEDIEEEELELTPLEKELQAIRQRGKYRSTHFLEYVYLTHPPKNGAVLDYASLQNPALLKELLKRAVFDYHPDRQGNAGADWRRVSTEITSILTSKMEKLKEMERKQAEQRKRAEEAEEKEEPAQEESTPQAATVESDIEAESLSDNN